MNFQSGVLDRGRLTSNILMILLVASNIFFAVQYIDSVKTQNAQQQAQNEDTTKKLQISRFMKFFIDTILNTKGSVSSDDRIKLENDIRQIHDSDLTKLWDAFVASKNGKEAQVNAVKLMSVMSSKMI